jgi:Protein of unknown function (DUF2975)
MKKLNILKTLLDIFWFFSIIGGIGILLFLPFYLTESFQDTTLKIKDLKIVNHTAFSKIIVVINAICSGIFVYSIYLIRKVVILFQKREIFNFKVSRLLNLIGISIVVSSVISNLSIMIYRFVERSRSEKGSFGTHIDFAGFDSFLIATSLGLFFMVLSTIFKIASTMKEENELTI